MARITGLAMRLGAGGLLLLVIAGYGGPWSAVLEAAAAFRLHLSALAAGLAFLALLTRQWRTAGISLLAAVLAAIGLGPVLEQAEMPGTPGGWAVTLLFANLSITNPEPAALLAALERANADILITAETSAAVADRPGGLRALYPHRQARPEGTSAVRTAIWSRLPLSGGRLYLNNTVAPTAASAVADLGEGVRLGLIGGHFSRPAEGQRAVQANALGPMADDLARPLVIAGDFNAPPWAWVLRRAAEATGTRILGGHRITWKGDYPTPFGPVPELWGHQIDHVLFSPGIVVDAVETIALPGSDHRGVLVRLRVMPP